MARLVVFGIRLRIRRFLLEAAEGPGAAPLGLFFLSALPVGRWRDLPERRADATGVPRAPILRLSHARRRWWKTRGSERKDPALMPPFFKGDLHHTHVLVRSHAEMTELWGGMR